MHPHFPSVALCVLHDAHPELWEVFADYYGYAFG